MEFTKDMPLVQSIGKIPSGLFIVTTAFEGANAAFLASFVQQVSFNPLIVSIACHPDRYFYKVLQKAGRFALNIVPENDEILMKTFAKGHGPEENLVSKVDHELLDEIPVLKDAIAATVFEIVSESEPGDHKVVFGKALDGTIFHPEKKPWVHTRKHGLSY